MIPIRHHAILHPSNRPALQPAVRRRCRQGDIMVNTLVHSGLQDVAVAETRISDVQGLEGELIIAGFPVYELASKATYEEVAYLLWYDKLPNPAELKAFSDSLAAKRTIPDITLQVLKDAARGKISVMDALRIGVGTLTLSGDVHDPDDVHADARSLVARFPTIVAAYWRMLNGEQPIAPRPDLTHTANYLYMLTGSEPSEEYTRGLETYMNAVVDHGMNASTFAARVIISTQSDLISAIVGAIGALKGPLHGGAPGPALDMVFEIREAANAEPYLREKLERGERLMGFGHRVYKVRDPRADVLGAATKKMFRTDGDQTLYTLAMFVEKTAIDLLEEYKPGRGLQTNVEFYTALLLHGLGMSTDLFSPTFACGRVAGWMAHCFEQQALNKIIRPQSVFVGERDREWIPLGERR